MRFKGFKIQKPDNEQIQIVKQMIKVSLDTKLPPTILKFYITSMQYHRLDW